MFCDEAKIKVIAGKGGDGAVSFRKEKFIPYGGPDGGDGGKGGNVIIKVDANLHTLSDFNTKKRFTAENGQAGAKKKMHGRNGQNLVLKVPPGTLVYSKEKEYLLADLTEIGEEFVLCKGGRGGYGNAHFTSSTRKTPRFAEKGEPGEEKEIVLEIKMIAEVGIIGLPSAGKSTLISHISNAKPKIADYHFTTLIPNLGVVELKKFGGDKEESFVIADVPGLIEGASEGKGLGHRFLKHIQRNKIIVHLIDGTLPDPYENYKIINKELKDYDKSLSEMPQFLVINKIDSIPNDEKENILKEMKSKTKKKCIYAISAVTGAGIKELLFAIWAELKKVRKKYAVPKKATIKPQLIELVDEDIKHVSIKKLKDKNDKKVFELKGKRLEQIVIMSDIHNDEALKRIYDVLNKLGASRRLISLGAEDGDILKIGNEEIEFLDLLD